MCLLEEAKGSSSVLGAARASKQSNRLQMAENGGLYGQSPCQPPSHTQWQTEMGAQVVRHLSVKPRLTVGNFTYLGDPFPSLLTPFGHHGLVPINHRLRMCFPRAVVSHDVLNSKPASVPDTLTDFFFNALVRSCVKSFRLFLLNTDALLVQYPSSLTRVCFLSSLFASRFGG